MKSLPSVSIVIITYSRPVEIRATITALQKNLYYDGELRYLIADDSSPDGYLTDLRKWFNSHCSGDLGIVKTPANCGWGCNFRTAYQQCDTDVIMLIEDDYECHHEIDISPYVGLLLENPRVGNMRLDGVAGHRVVAHMAECNISDYLPHYQQGSAYPGMFHYWLLDSGSPELWLASNRPSLRHKRWFDYYGLYKEGLKLGDTETEYAHRVKDAMRADSDNAPCIAVPLDATCYFTHIGRSYQHTEFDHEYVVK